MKFLLARAIPYVLTFFAGAAVFWVSFAYPSVWSDWLIEISGALSAIPIVFLIYDYFNYRITTQANKKQADDLSNQIDTIVMEIMMFFYGAMGGRGKPGRMAIQKLVDSPTATINRNLRLRKKDISQLHEYKNRLDTIIYRAGTANIFDSTRFDMALDIMHSLSHIINDLEYSGGRSSLVKYTQNLFDSADNWLDSRTEKATTTQIQTQSGDNA